MGNKLIVGSLLPPLAIPGVVLYIPGCREAAAWGNVRMGTQVRRTVSHRQGQVRRKPKWQPVWQGGPYEGWARSWVSKHHWRIAATHPDHDDAMAECAVVFTKCWARYIRSPEQGYSPQYKAVDNGAHFMALYKQALYYRWIRLADNDSRLRTVEAPLHVEDIDQLTSGRRLSTTSRAVVEHDPAYYSANFIQPPDGLFASALAVASDELKLVIGALVAAPQEVLTHLFEDLQGAALFAPEHRTKLNNRLRRWCKLSNSVDVIGQLADLLA